MVSYEFYLSVYRGNALSSAEWSETEPRASDQLERYKRIYTVTAPNVDAESMAVCAMAEALHNISLVASGGAAVQSASVGSVSTTYSSTASAVVDVSEKGQSRALYRAACLYLDIYRGGC